MPRSTQPATHLLVESVSKIFFGCTVMGPNQKGHKAGLIFFCSFHFMRSCWLHSERETSGEGQSAGGAPICIPAYRIVRRFL